MKKNKAITLILAAMLTGSVLTAWAQDVTVLHMKDGTTRRYSNGNMYTTNMQFWQFTPDTTANATFTTRHANQYETEWNVDEVWQYDGQYNVGIVWMDDFPVQDYARHGLIFGTSPNLTAESCDTMVYVNDDAIQGIWYGTRGMVNKEKYNGSVHYVIIGPSNRTFHYLDGYSYDVTLELNTLYSLNNRIMTPLEPGKTYYYRTFIKAMVEQGGEREDVFLYGSEKNFRVPVVMADFGYYSSYIPTPDACTDFYQKHFPDSVMAPTYTDWESLWTQWRATDAGSKVDLTPDATSQEFEDGTGYRLNRIPDEFYRWVSQREIVIDVPDGLTEVSTYQETGSCDLFPTVSPDTITVDDDSLGIPGGKYIRFTPLRTTVNHSATFSSSEVVPGVRYKLEISFAPETKYMDEENATLPTLVRVMANDMTIFFNGSQTSDVSGTEVTKLVNEDFSTTEMGLDLRIETRVSSLQLKRLQYNRILRIAEIRLTPVKE